ncbi:Putative TMEM33/Pom33 family protein [Septoria linicola]|uniref:TMEM33/Pom33 family protein n=1 Tax=Septoria linicola TaxID=215465 RepID=A0A9Q9AYL9_9PEZI|nr:putative TMEM33/Pom33 family protein [Septoria linicola]USW53036.1 Putative TMEM33/Pom33 family protein [Septoria linicola]
MAPPATSANEPLQERLLKLVQTLQFAWFVGHVTLLLTAIRYSLSYIFFNYYSKMAQFSYRTAFVAAAATYGIVVFKGYRARAKSGKQPSSPLALAGDENVQYLAMALLWLFSKQYPLALLPYSIYSVFHVLTYTRGILLPVLQPQPAAAAGQKPASSGLADTLGSFVKNYYDASMSIVAGLELALWFRILGSAIIFAKGSWIILALYTVFLRARISQSTFVQGMIKQLGARGDALTQRQDVPPVARQAWETAKNVLAQVHGATDINRYVQGGPQSTPKKAQ